MKFPRKNPQDGGENEDNDRKPAAAQVPRVVRGPNNNDNINDQQQDAQSEAGDESRASTDVASVPSSWVSPVARAPSHNSFQHQHTQSYRTPQQKDKSSSSISKKNTPKTAPPGLTMATPYTTQQNYNDELIKPAPPAVANNQSPNDAVLAATQQSLQTMQRQFILWMGTTALGIAVMLYEVLPTAALTALLFIVASTGMFSQSAYWTARQWYYNTVVMGPGLAPLVPASLYEMLTQTSLDEYLTDPTFALEYRHLLLYFLPLSDRQREAALQQLAPAHRARLLRPGLGHLLPAPVERLLYGAAAVATTTPTQQPASTNATIALDDYNENENNGGEMNAPGVQRQLLLYDDSDDDESDLGLDVSTDDLTGGLSDNQADMMARRLGLQHGTAENNNNNNTPIRPRDESNNNDDNNTPIDEEEANRELDVLMNAFWDSAYGTVWSPVRDAIVVPSVSFIRRAATWSAILGAGGYGLWFWSSTTATLPPLGLWLQQTVQSTLTPLLGRSSRVLQSVSSTVVVVPSRDRQPRTWNELSNTSGANISNFWLMGGATSVVGLALYYARRNYYYNNNHARQISNDKEDEKED